jgi:hypothetical protein
MPYVSGERDQEGGHVFEGPREFRDEPSAVQGTQVGSSLTGCAISPDVDVFGTRPKPMLWMDLYVTTCQ